MINSVVNFRDVSGYINTEGKEIIPGRIFRGGSLDDITSPEISSFYKDLNIKNIIDFRGENEVLDKPDPEIPGTEHHHLNALKNIKGFDGFDFGHILGTNPSDELINKAYDYLLAGYESMPIDNLAFKKAFDILLENNGSTYIHCSAGKDRTGLLVYLLMRALGFSHEDGLSEYLKSNEYINLGFDAYIEKLGIASEKLELYKPLLFVNETFLNKAMDRIKAKYSNLEDYFLNELNLDEQKLLRLKSYYLND